MRNRSFAGTRGGGGIEEKRGRGKGGRGGGRERDKRLRFHGQHACTAPW